MMSVSKKSYVRYFAYVSERSQKEMHRLGKLTGKPVTKETIILDMDQLSGRQMAYKPGKISSL